MRSELESPFRRDGLVRRTAPFLVAMVVAFAAVRLPAVERDDSGILTAALVNVALIALVFFLPWQKLPRTAELLPPLLYMVVIALLRDALGGATSAYSPMLILPILWLAMYGTRAQLGVGVAGAAVLLAMPPLLIGEPEYSDVEWRRVLLWVTVGGITGLAVQDLVEQVRQRASALHTVSAAVGRRTREAETRSAICEAAKENARADYALLLEPDSNGRRLVTTAATSARVEATEVYLTNSDAPATRTFLTGRDQFQQEVEEPPFLATNGTYTEAASVLWHAVPGRDGTLGVLAVGWSNPVKRLPETLPAVMEALAAEAAGVIERTTLLVQLESVVKVDEATGLPNARAWEEEVPREISRARRQGTPLSVVILDLGGVERNADGDLTPEAKQMLRTTADRWRAELQPSDFLADPAPGRFAALLPNRGADEAEELANRMRAGAPMDRDVAVAVATWNGTELPAAFVGRAEAQIELERAAARAD